MRRRFVTVDVFTDRVFGGNPLAVVLDAEGLTVTQMQSIAAEFNYSETTFVLPPRDPAHTAQVRIFTPRVEVPFAGHPNVGTAFVLARTQRARARSAPLNFVFEETAGLVPVTVVCAQGAIAGAEFRAPEPLSCRSELPLAAAAACLSLGVEDLLTTRHAPLVASVGLPFLIVELASPAALARARPDRAAHERTLPRDGADSVFTYYREPDEHVEHGQLHARMFAPLDGVQEDPATGSATAASLALLARLNPNRDAERLWRVYQGVAMGRPSLMLGRTQGASVYVGGHCVEVMTGTINMVGASAIPATGSML